MFRSLRNRLILSHILPALLIIPLMGAAMVYVLETRLLLPMIYNDLARDATLMAEITRNQPIFWQNSQAAQVLVDGVSPYLSGRLSFVTTNGLILATTDTVDGGVGTHVIDLPDLTDVEQGEIIQLQRGSMAEVFTPVYDLRGESIGIVRLTARVVTISDQIYQLRYLLGRCYSGCLGAYCWARIWLNINRPIQRDKLDPGPGEGRLANASRRDGPESYVPWHRQSMRQDQLNSLGWRGVSCGQSGARVGPPSAPSVGNPAMLKGGQRAQLAHLLAGIDSRPHASACSMTWRCTTRLGGGIKPYRSSLMNGWRHNFPVGSCAKEKGLVWEWISPGWGHSHGPDRMAQALGNLLSNAIKFTPPEGRVATNAKMKDGQLMIQVADSGPGVLFEEQGRIFQPFYRGAHGRRIVEGMGLGLSIARDIVVAHGGEIDLESTPGAGSRFTLRMPVEIPPEV
jgi:hypothetical protein